MLHQFMQEEITMPKIKKHIRCFSRLLTIIAFACLLLPAQGCGKQTIYDSSDSYEAAGTSSSNAGRTTTTAPATSSRQPVSEEIIDAPVATGTTASQSSSTQTTPARGTKPYTVMGQTYHPLHTAEGFTEEGLASWYGKDFHGKQTANGERYDMYGMTAAHKLLPFGTMVRVTSLENGKSIVVRINDRGPFVKNRVIDLTNTGAKELGILEKGTGPVRLETVGTVKGLEHGVLTGNFYVQVGAFGVEANATNLVQSLRSRGLHARAVYASNIGFWRVQIGPYKELDDAESAAVSFDAEFPRCFVIAD